MNDTPIPPLYVLCWSYRGIISTSFYGTRVMPHEEATRLAKQANLECPLLHHWPELAPVEEPTTESETRT